MTDRYICIHGHFYQPPRENPWLEEVELQESSYPHHDWNERINAECYAPNTASRIIDSQGRVMVIGNNYAKISFNFGPTLLAWMERHAPDTYQSIIEADKLSKDQFSGHGSAIAQAYNHIILPLANRRDKRTQIIWGIRDFEKRFKRHPEGMWLPETAVDIETLDILAELGIRFTILSPYQAKSVKEISSHEWADASNGRIDPTMPYRCNLPSGRHINLYFYDGPISREVAFSNLLSRGDNFAQRLISVFADGSRPQIVHIATDGETYGHHHQFGDMALSYCLHYIQSNNLAKITNYGEYLDKYPPTHEAEIFENSSWSCFHGVERWRENCGCNSGMHPGWTQTWRKPLRNAFDWLRDSLIPVYEREAAKYLYDPWEARDDYINVILNRSTLHLDDFFNKHSSRRLIQSERVAATKLLEMQRNALLMYTSCGWFFDEVSGIETVQVMQYSCRALQLAKEVASVDLEPEFLAFIDKVPTNLPELKNGAYIYNLYVKPAQVDFIRLGAHYAIASLLDEYSRKAHIYCYSADSDIFEKRVSGKSSLLILRTVIASDITDDRSQINAAVLHLGDHNINCGVRDFIDEKASGSLRSEIITAFDMADMLGVMRLMEKHFGANDYTLANLFKEEQRKLLYKIIQPSIDQIYLSINRTCEDNCNVIDFLKNLNIPVPDDLMKIMGYKVNYDLENCFTDGIDLALVARLVNNVKRWALQIDTAKIGLITTNWINAAMDRLEHETENMARINNIEQVLAYMNTIRVPLNLWKTQNIYFSLDSRVHQAMKQKAAGGDTHSSAWVEAFHRLGEQLRIKE